MNPLSRSSPHLTAVNLTKRFPPPRLRSGAVQLSPVQVGYQPIDLLAQHPLAMQHHAFCDAVIVIDRGRRPIGSFRAVEKPAALAELRAAWPIQALHPLRRPGQLAAKLAQQVPVYSLQLSRDPKDLLRLLDDMHPNGSARPLIASTPDPATKVAVSRHRARPIPA